MAFTGPFTAPFCPGEEDEESLEFDCDYPASD
jgi:hypothetical protein